MRIRLDSIGCRLNISEIEKMARDFVSQGHRLVGPGELADLYIFNSCTVTQPAARTSRQIIRQLRRGNPQATLVVTGCYAQLSAQAVEELGADLVVDNQQKENLIQLLAAKGLLHEADPIPPVLDPLGFGNPKGLSAEHTRAFIKVQDGCNNRCTFCIVTVARGAARSRPVAEIITEINRLVEAGYQEAVLSGVHLGFYGHDEGHPNGLRHLIQTILAKTDLPRLRLSSLEPWDLQADFFEMWQEPRLLPHLHLPLQSGCEATLRRMGRRTTQADFSQLVQAARATIADLSITTDIMVGFPGETEAEFADSLAFVEKMAFAKLHIFRYSKRVGTAAATMKNQLPAPVAQERSRHMHLLGDQLERNFRQQFVGRTMPVLWENSEPCGYALQWSGFTGNYLRVTTQTLPEIKLRNKIIETHLIGLTPAALQGKLTRI